MRRFTNIVEQYHLRVFVAFSFLLSDSKELAPRITELAACSVLTKPDRVFLTLAELEEVGVGAVR